MTAELSEITGSRGEAILELSLTEYKDFVSPLFRPGFLGDKWPTIDFYVELRNIKGRTPYFFAQAKSSSGALLSKSKSLRISSRRIDIARRT